MPEVIACPRCQRRLHLPDGVLDATVQCPSCQAEFPATEARPALPPNRAISSSPVSKEVPTLERYEPAAPRRRSPLDRSRFADARLAKKPRSKVWLVLLLLFVGVGVLFAVIGIAANTVANRKPMAVGPRAFPPPRIPNGGPADDPDDADLDGLGGDAVGWYRKGEALRKRKKFPEAARAYRTSLDLNPQDATVYRAFLFSLDGDADMSDIGPRFALLKNRRTNFDVLAADCEERKFPEILEPLAEMMIDLDPDYAPADYYLALSCARLGQPEQAVRLFQVARAKQPDPRKREQYGRELQKILAETRHYPEAYAVAPDAVPAFRELAAAALKGYEVEGLQHLVAAHAKAHAADPLLPLYQAAAYVREERYALADKTFAAALTKPQDEDTLLPFRQARVEARYHTGQALAAYRDIGPRQETFTQLASQAYYDEDDALLQALLDAHAKNDPESLDLLAYRCRLLIRQDRVPAAVALFKAALAKPLADDKRTQVVSEFLADLWGAGKTVEGYRAAPDARQAFLLLTEDMDDEGEYAELPQLVAAHRERDPTDPLLAYYQGRLHLQAKAWDQAAQVLGEGLKTAPEAWQDRYRSQYIFAQYKAGRGLQAYADSAVKDKAFTQLAALLVADKQGTDLDALVAAHRAHNGDTPELSFNEALARILDKRPTEAGPLVLRAYHMQTVEHQRNNYVYRYLMAMTEAGHMLEAYRVAPDKAVAFETLAANLVRKKKDKELAALLEEHAKGTVGLSLCPFYKGELDLLRGNARAALREFVAGKAQCKKMEQVRYRYGVLRASVQAGEAVAAYRLADVGPNHFEELADLCVAAKDVKQLQALLDAHREARPDDPNLPVWEVAVAWLNQDYEGVLQRLDKHADDVFALPRHRWKAGDYRVRCLVKLKRPQDAVRAAEAVTKRGAGNRTLLVLAIASTGDVKQTIAVLDKPKPLPYLLRICYQDADLGPLLRSDPFRAFREKYPEPKDPKGLADRDEP